jgi:hypothetical protein
MLNKLARTFAVQVEALKKYRSTGEQSIRVQHVTVNDGGQCRRGEGWQQKRSINLMNLVRLMNQAPRCSATSKRSRQRYRAPAVKGWTVCRCHGARGGAPSGKANGSYKHGGQTREAKATRRDLAELVRAVQDTLAMLDQADQRAN